MDKLRSFLLVLLSCFFLFLPSPGLAGHVTDDGGQGFSTRQQGESRFKVSSFRTADGLVLMRRVYENGDEQIGRRGFLGLGWVWSSRYPAGQRPNQIELDGQRLYTGKGNPQWTQGDRSHWASPNRVAANTFGAGGEPNEGGGIRITNVNPGTPAANLGEEKIKVGDVITMIKGNHGSFVKINQKQQYYDAVHFGPNPMTFVRVRDGKPSEVQVNLNRPAWMEEESKRSALSSGPDLTRK